MHVSERGERGLGRMHNQSANRRTASFEDGCVLLDVPILQAPSYLLSSDTFTLVHSSALAGLQRAPRGGRRAGST